MDKADTLHIKKVGILFKARKSKFNKETIQAIDDVKTGKNLSKTFDSVDKMFEELDKE